MKGSDSKHRGFGQSIIRLDASSNKICDASAIIHLRCVIEVNLVIPSFSKLIILYFS